MLEPADLDASTTVSVPRPTYALVAQSLLAGDADVGVFLADAYDKLAGVTRSRLRPLVTSQIGVINHMLMVGPALAHRIDDLRGLLTGVDEDPKLRSITEGLGFTAWLPVGQEDTEFMIDLIDTLLAE